MYLRTDHSAAVLNTNEGPGQGYAPFQPENIRYNFISIFPLTEDWGKECFKEVMSQGGSIQLLRKAKSGCWVSRSPKNFFDNTVLFSTRLLGPLVLIAQCLLGLLPVVPSLFLQKALPFFTTILSTNHYILLGPIFSRRTSQGLRM